MDVRRYGNNSPPPSIRLSDQSLKKIKKVLRQSYTLGVRRGIKWILALTTIRPPSKRLHIVDQNRVPGYIFHSLLGGNG